MSTCSRCGGNLFNEDGDEVCLQCGRRQVADPVKSARLSDPFDAAVAALAEALRAVKDEAGKAEDAARRRKVQVRRLERAAAILAGTGSSGSVSGSRQWSPEQREAARKRMKDMHAAKKGAKAAA